MIKFISYDGKYPHLCSGVLTKERAASQLALARGQFTVEIDGKLYAFCSITEHDPTHFRLFWKGRGCLRSIPNLTLVYGVAFEPGGTLDLCSMIETKGKWTIDLEHAVRADGKPFLLKGIAGELSDVMNEHVEWGCCGGCF